LRGGEGTRTAGLPPFAYLPTFPPSNFVILPHQLGDELFRLCRSAGVPHDQHVRARREHGRSGDRLPGKGPVLKVAPLGNSASGAMVSLTFQTFAPMSHTTGVCIMDRSEGALPGGCAP